MKKSRTLLVATGSAALRAGPYALRLAGWPEGEEVWTGSPPCQPFSAAGKGRAEEDPRHLWPAFRRLISECRPATVFGEQVGGKAGREWLAGVRADLEELGYRVGAADLPACSVGAPHIRQRIFWLADSERAERRTVHISRGDEGSDGILQGQEGAGRAGGVEQAGRLGYPDEPRPQGRGLRRDETDQGRQRNPWASSLDSWLPCADGKARRLVAGISPLVARLPRNMGWNGPGDNPYRKGPPSRVGMLRGYGNAIVPQVAAEFIAAYMETK